MIDDLPWFTHVREVLAGIPKFDLLPIDDCECQPRGYCAVIGLPTEHSAKAFQALEAAGYAVLGGDDDPDGWTVSDIAAPVPEGPVEPEEDEDDE